ncbi:hypothetical protein V1505DRAFT_358114 [Lipomyces doorenjongii]
MTDTAKTAKTADPEYFKGDRRKLRDFFAQLTLKFTTNRHLFPDEDSKVGYAASSCADMPSQFTRP